MAKDKSETEETKPAIYDTLDALVMAEGKRISEKEKKVYQVQVNGKPKYLMANSPGQAALSVCTVQKCTEWEIMNAAIRNASERNKQERGTP